MARRPIPSGDFNTYSDPSTPGAWAQLLIVLLLLMGLGGLAATCGGAPVPARSTCGPASAGAGAAP